MESVIYIDETGRQQKLSNYTVVTSDDTEWTSGFYVVNADTTIEHGVTVTGDVKLILKDGVTLTVNASATAGAAGITVTNGSTATNYFTVYGQSSGDEAGVLSATGGDGGAGIGGGLGESGSQITLAGGTVVATGGTGAAGIGGGRTTSETDIGHGTDILITGGTVIARGDGGAGIGGGYRQDSDTGGKGERITITGGVVDAKSNNCSDPDDTHSGAGIGGGYGDNADGSDITISGGKVIATSTDRGAGIGGGGFGVGSNITISGGTVTATGDSGAGIGCGFKGGNSSKLTGSNITISGGTVTASSTSGDTMGKGASQGLNYSGIYVNTEVQLQVGTSAADAEDKAHTTGITAEGVVAGQKYAKTQPGASVSYVDKDGKELTLTYGSYQLVSGSDSAVTWTAGCYVVGKDYDNNGVINAADATYAKENSLDYKFTITGGATVTGAVKLIVADGFSLTVDATATSGAAGIRVVSGTANSFNVYGQTDGTGNLIAKGGWGGAGIGGNNNEVGSHITIAGGTVTATAGYRAAGIGGGNGQKGTDITIAGGKVTATGNSDGAGIGGGRWGGADTIKITGGSVKATAGGAAAGIGSGYDSQGQGGAKNITIEGGVVAASATSGAGIGSGASSAASGITISGGTVIATSNSSAIGSGSNGAAASQVCVATEQWLLGGTSQASATEISHATGTDIAEALAGQKYVTALTPYEVSFIDEDGNTQVIGGTSASKLAASYTLIATSASAVTWTAGYYVVGADYNGDGVINAEDADLGTKDFTITGGATVTGDVKLIVADGFKLTVSATGGTAGIRVTNADSENPTNLFTVYGQSEGTGLLAATSSDGAGIGGKNGTEGGSHITIAGGTVTAVSTYGAGIGGGNGGTGSHITITGGVVDARSIGGTTKYGGAGIGGGDSNSGSDIKITGGTVFATGSFGAGIGGGYNGSASGIRIEGGTVTANSTGGSAIGGGTYKSASNVFVNTELQLLAGASSENATEVVHSTEESISSSLAGQKYAKTQPGASVSYVDKDGKEQTLTYGSYQLVSGGTAAVSWTAGCYVVGKDYDNNGVINAADATYAKANSLDYEFTITGGATVTGAVKLIVADGFSLTVDATATSGAAGVRVVGGTANSFNVYAQTDGTGNLIAKGGANGAGIGGNSNEEGSCITIAGGTVTATGGFRAAGIGGGTGRSGTDITITGGKVTATGNTDAAGIGGGRNGGASNIKITGGTVNAIAGGLGAGIGSGFESNAAGQGGAENITITGGVVTATATSGAAIGSAKTSTASGITITGGTVTATASAGAGIGSGSGKNATGITITGGTINATSSDGAGIGGGASGTGSTIRIEQGSVTATSTLGAGIGGGNGGAGSGITITGGTINAKSNGGSSKYGGAGIGGGDSNPGSGITISGGTVTATGSYGAGIGGGYGAAGSDIEISGGTVTAKATTWGAGIGSGFGSVVASDIRITGGTVNATGSAGAGVGGGRWGTADGITISGGNVTAATSTSSGHSAIGSGAGANGSSSNIKVSDAIWTVNAGSSSASTDVIEHTATEDIADKLSTKKYAAVRFETVTVSADTTVDTSNQQIYQAASGNAFTVEENGVLNLAQGITFTGNTGAIVNAGTVNVTGAFTLATANDTIVNNGTLNWDLTAGSTTNLDFAFDCSKLSGSGTKSVTVSSDAQYGGNYALAAGVAGDFAITLKGLDQDYELSLNGTSSVTVGTTYYGLSKTLGTVSLTIAEVKACGSTTQCGGTATRITDGSNAKMFFGGTVCKSASALECNSSVSIAGGTFLKSIASGSVASGCEVQQTGNLDLTIEGGTYSQRVAGGMYAADTEEATSAELTGDVKLTIKGGTFTGRIYGGSNAQTDAVGKNTTITGDVNVTVDSSTNAIYVGNYLIGGSRGAGRITGDVTVTFTGFGSDTEYVTAGKGLTFNGGTSVVAGGSNGDIVKILGGTRTTSSTVTGSRNLVFDDFDGNFDADLRLFSTATFKNGTDVTFTDTRVNLWTVETWNFELGSSFSNLQANDFEGDTLNFDVTGLTTDWTVGEGTVKAFDDLKDAAAVYFGDSAATYDTENACWTDGTYKLALNDGKNAMIVSKIA